MKHKEPTAVICVRIPKSDLAVLRMFALTLSPPTMQSVLEEALRCPDFKAVLNRQIQKAG